MRHETKPKKDIVADAFSDTSKSKEKACASFKKAKLKSKKIKKKKIRDPKQIAKRIEIKRSKIEDSLKDLVIPRPKNPDEARYLEEYVRMLNMNSNIIKRLNKQIQRSKLVVSKDLYALSTIMSQQREVIADIRTITDMSEQVGLITDTILQPMIKAIGQNLLDTFYQKRKLLTNTCKPDEAKFALKKLDAYTSDQAKFLQQVYEEALEKLNDLLIA
jgi:hypothetical protein